MAVANCPGCGGPIEFSIGSSIVVICDHCRSVVARTDRALEDLGKVAALIDTGSPLRRDLPGTFDGTNYRLVGRTQMEHSSGGIWDEWYAAFDDGRWGWIAEAQGRFYLTFVTAVANLPPFEEIEVGGRIGDLVVTEIGNARVVGGEGEIPWRVIPNSTYDYVDLSGPAGNFATIDYSDDKPALFTGVQTTLEGLGVRIDSSQTIKPRVQVEKLSCGKCGGQLELVAPDRAERVICPRCGAMHDVSAGKLQLLKALSPHGHKPSIPLGTKGTIDGVEYVLAGFMRRSVTFDRKYEWGEYLLFNRDEGFRWLIESDHHWSFAWPIAAGDVVSGTMSQVEKRLAYRGKTYKIFQDAEARVESVIGEFYWKVAVGEEVRALDYINPPMAISKEIASVNAHDAHDSGGKKKKSTEVNYSLSKYMSVGEIEKAFGIGPLPKPTTVGMQQPYGGPSILPIWSGLIVALVLIAMVIAGRGPNVELFAQSLDFTAPVESTTTGGDWSTPSEAPPGSPASHVIFTKPFHLSGGRNLQLDASCDVENHWVYVSGDLVNEESGLIEGFELPIEYYHGVDGGESWSEGSRSVTRVLSALPAGSYVLRLEGQWEENTTPPPVHIAAREGVFLWSHFFLAFLAITLPAALIGFRHLTFENARWAEASYTQQGIPR